MAYIMKLNVVFSLFLIFFVGCTISSIEHVGTPLNQSDVQKGLEVKDLIFSEENLMELGLTGYDCFNEEYETLDSPDTYCFNNYTIDDLNDTNVFIIFSKYDSFHDLNGSYQYESSHYFSVEGLISENAYGDLSRFRVSNVNDYGGKYNDPNIYVYHLWIVKDLYLIHITSRGSIDAKEYIEESGNQILLKFN